MVHGRGPARMRQPRHALHSGSPAKANRVRDPGNSQQQSSEGKLIRPCLDQQAIELTDRCCLRARSATDKIMLTTLRLSRNSCCRR